MFDCFKGKKKEGSKKVVEPVVKKPGKKIQIVVGHNRSSRGAVNYLGESEYTFNSRIAEKLAVKLAEYGHQTIIEKRPVASYSVQCDHIERETLKNQPDFSLHLHFNSYNKKVMGCEAYICGDASQSVIQRSAAFADTFTDILNERYGFKERYEDGVLKLYSGHNGYGMMVKTSKYCPAVLVEPCFANIKTEESRLIFENEDKYVDVIVDSFKKFF